MIGLGIDPGSKKCGWAIVDLEAKKVIAKGHDDLNEMRKVIQGEHGLFDEVIIEMLVRYHGSNSIDLLGTAYAIGRLREMIYTHSSALALKEFTRPEVIFRLTGRWPGKSHKVSKADLQKVVQKLLKLDNPIRPQHANDAAALVIATTHPVKAILNVKSRQGRKPAQTQSRRRPQHT